MELGPIYEIITECRTSKCMALEIIITPFVSEILKYLIVKELLSSGWGCLIVDGAAQ
jgi:hypothetical protein